MADYIERQAAVRRFEQLKEQADTMRDKLYLDGVLAVIDALPYCVNVREDVQGEWEWMGPCRDAAGRMWATCSACKVRQRLGDYDSFCPNCGAKMKNK